MAQPAVAPDERCKNISLVLCVCVWVWFVALLCVVSCAHMCVCVCVRVCGVCCVLCIVFQGGWAGCGTSLNESGKIPKPCPFGSGRGLWPWILTELGTLAGEWDPEVSQGYPRGIREVSQKYPRGIPVDIPSIAPEKPECVLVGHVSVSGCVFASVARLSAQLSFIVNSQEHEQTNTHTHTHTHTRTYERKQNNNSSRGGANHQRQGEVEGGSSKPKAEGPMSNGNKKRIGFCFFYFLHFVPSMLYSFQR